MGHSVFDVDDKQHLVARVLDQTSKESMIKCAHDSGGLIGSCTSSRENCECGLCFIIEELSGEEDRHGDAAYFTGVDGELDGTPQVH